MYTTAEKQLIINGFIDKYSDKPQELHEKASNLEEGLYHRGLAIDAFNKLESGTDTSDLKDYLEEAQELLPLLDAALGYE